MSLERSVRFIVSKYLVAMEDVAHVARSNRYNLQECHIYLLLMVLRDVAGVIDTTVGKSGFRETSECSPSGRRHLHNAKDLAGAGRVFLPVARVEWLTRSLAA